MRVLEELILHHGAEAAGSAVAELAVVLSLILAAIAFWTDARSRKVENQILLSREYRALWSLPIRHPELARVLNPDADIAKAPITFQEERFVLLLISHLNAVLEAGRHREVNLSDSTAADVGAFFRLPIPSAIWGMKRNFQDSRLVNFVESALGTDL